MAVTPVTYGMLDHSNERTGTTLNFPEIEADGSNWDTLFTATTGTKDVVGLLLYALSKLNPTRDIASIIVGEHTEITPAAADAQREWGILFTYQDLTTHKKYRFTVPAPVDAAVQAGTDVVDLANVLVAAFTTAFELDCVSPDGNAVEVISARIIGRSS